MLTIAAPALCLLLVPRATPDALASASASLAQDPAIQSKIDAAGKDVAKLLALAAACTDEEQAKIVYRRVVEIDAANETARKALRHQLYDGKWFESFAELSKYKREEAARMKTKGLARFQDQWVPEADLPFLNMGWSKDAGGQWVGPLEIARRKLAEERTAAGWKFRADDNSWVAPEDQDKWAALQWKCGDAWLDMEKANEFHARLETNWELVGERFETWSTCDWETANFARWHADRIWPVLVGLFGIEPRTKPHFVVLRSLDQYNQAASNGTLPETEGYSSLHGAYFSDVLFDGSKPPQYQGCGVAYWDRKDPKLAVWGPYWVRWAAAQSFVEAIDPSWNAVGERAVAGPGGDGAATTAAFWAEKRIPRWLRYGAAAYAERFLRDPEAAEGADPWALRTFAFAEVKKAGGLRKLDDVFAFALSLNDVPGSSRLYNEAGLIVSYLLDGAPDDEELAAKLDAFRAALKSGTKADATAAANALQKSLAKREREIRKYAGL